MTQTAAIKVTSDASKVYVSWDSGKTSAFHNIWLRDTCQCEACFHPVTKQRLQDTFIIPEDIAPTSTKINGSTIQIEWNDKSHVSVYEQEWLYLHSYDPVLVSLKEKKKLTDLDLKLWDVPQITSDLPFVDFKDVMKSDDGVKEWTRKIYVYGFCLIKDVPETTDDTEKLVERLAYVRPTHYGGFWDFTADLAKNDTAYTNLELGTHTDGTYWSDTPGLQLFHLLHHYGGSGGETTLVDSFNCAKILKKEDPSHYELLKNTRIPAHSAGEENVCILPTTPQPIFNHDPITDELVQVRWNNNDRSVMDNWSNPEDVVKFYGAIRHWYDILTRKENEYIFQLKAGTCLIFDNWRVFHGRKEFTGSRRMCGAYVNRDDYISRFRLLNFGREQVLKTL